MSLTCVDEEQDQLRKQDPWTHGQLPRIHPSRWPEVARQDRWTERLEPGLRVKGEPGTGRGWRRSDGESCAPERGVARRPSHCPGSLRGEPRRPRRAVLVPPSFVSLGGARAADEGAVPESWATAGLTFHLCRWHRRGLGVGWPRLLPTLQFFRLYPWERVPLLKELFLTFCYEV